jgi:hypothetical protein
MKKTPGRSLDFGEWGRLAEERLASYQGDSYLVDELIESGEYTPEAAQQEVQDPDFLKSWLEYDGIKEILVDRIACKGLLKAILQKRADVIDKLISEIRWLKIAKKRGPKAKMVEGQYIYEWVVKLRDERHLSWGKIAMRLWHDPRKGNLAKAHYTMARKRLAAHHGPLAPGQ